MNRRRLFTVLLLVPVLPGTLVAFSSRNAGAKPADPVLVKARQSVTKGLGYLRHVQESDGSWGEYPATTALGLSAFLHNGRNEVNDPTVAKGVQFLLKAIRPDGGIYSNANAAVALPNYNTSLSIMALSLTHNPSYKGIILKAQRFLEKSQYDEVSGIQASNPAYGGIGYGDDPGDDKRPDLSNLSMALEALHDSGTPANAPVFKKAIVFLQRVQNRKESNDQAWEKTASGDGGFVYNSQGGAEASAGPGHSYGSMTYAGLKSYIYAGVSKNDPRAQSAFNWIRGHYSVDDHPGFGSTSLYYYYHTMAKTLDVYGQKIVRDTKGASHDWGHDLAARISAVQRPDGSWYNDNARYWENQPPLVTSYSLIALSYCLKR